MDCNKTKIIFKTYYDNPQVYENKMVVTGGTINLNSIIMEVNSISNQKIKTLTVGNGITINGNEVTVNFGVDLFPNDYLVDIYFDKIVEKGLLLRSY